TRRATLDASFVGSGGNFNPTALIDITSQTGKRPNRTVVLDSNRSSDIDGTITSRSWAIDPAPVSLTTNGDDSVATAVFSAAGTYTARLTLTDDDGGQTTAEADIVVDNLAPLPSVELTNCPPAPDPCDEGAVEGPNQHTFEFSAAGTTDDDGDGIVGYSWDFGDPSEILGVTGQGTASATVIYRSSAALGWREVKLTVTDSLGATAVDRALIRLLDASGQPPVIGDISVATSGEPGGELVNTPGRNPRAGTVGPGITPVDMTFSTALSPPFTWELFHGVTPVATSTDAVFPRSFAEGDDGDWKIVLTPTGGMPTEIDFRLNRAPVADFVVNGTGPAPSSRNFDSSISNDDSAITSHLWNFGFFNNWTSTAANPSQSFSHPGTYNVILAVTDDDGYTTTRMRQVALSGNLDPPPAGVFDANVYKWLPVPGAQEYRVHLQITAAPGCTASTGPVEYTFPISENPSFSTAYAGCGVTARHQLRVDATWGAWSAEVTRP
ncbi:MAG: PKD domain-containing protein, partial [Microthrixaceae bacterium]